MENTVKENWITRFIFDSRLVVQQLWDLLWDLIAFLGHWEFSEQIAKEIHWDLFVRQQTAFQQIL